MRPSRAAARAAACLLFLAFTACKRTEVAYDFAVNLPNATLTAETGRIDFGERESRRFLENGWSLDETWTNPAATVVWSIGTASRLVAYRFDNERDAVIGFRCLPFVRGPRPQTVRFVVNGHALDPVVLNPGFNVYQQPVPARMLRSGANDIRIDYGYASPASATDPRLLAVAWDWMEFNARPSGAARRAGETILLPPRTQLTFLAEVGRDCSLRLDSVNGAADVLIGAETHPVSPGSAVDLPLHASRRALTEFGFVHRRNDDSWLELVHPRIECAVERAAKPPEVASGARPNVLIYLVDTLRADHLGVYGYRRKTSPNIDAFARDSVVFTNAIAQSGWTKTSTASILTGLVPFHHGALDRDDALPAAILTLPLMLRDAGYSRYAAVANGNVAPEFGFGRGFEPYEYLNGKEENSGAVAGTVVDTFARWLDRRKTAAPFFAYLHTIDPHDPYAAPPPYAEQFRADIKTTLHVALESEIAALLKTRPDLTMDGVRSDLIAKYDAEIVYNDAMFGRAVADLKRRGLYDSALIIFTSDHGEEFLDHGHWGHGHSLYHELIHVPLIVKFPHGRDAGRVISANVQHADIVPTVLGAARVENRWKLDGDPLMRVPELAERRIVSWLRMDQHNAMSAVYGTRQYILRGAPSLSGEELLVFGPSGGVIQGEAWRRELRKTLVAYYLQSKSIQAPQVPLQGEVARKLRALGYLR